MLTFVPNLTLRVMLTLLFSLLALSVTPVGDGLTATERSLERQGMVCVTDVDSTIRVSLMYSRADNFTGRVLYSDLNRAYLHPEAARALKRAQAILRRRRPDLSLAVYDAARPMSVQQTMWDAVKNTPKYFYVSNPARGGGLHNYGLAVDVTLCDAASGDTLDMGTPIDHMGAAAHIDREAALQAGGTLTAEAVRNRRLLRSVMREAGFKALRTEWWHFNFKSRAEAKARYRFIR